MADDQASFVRNFCDSNQQLEVESRSRSLERQQPPKKQQSKKDSSAYYPVHYSTIDRFVRGESVDDSIVGDNNNDNSDNNSSFGWQNSAFLRKSSVESE